MIRRDTVETDFLADGIRIASKRSPLEPDAEHDPIDEPLLLVVLGVYKRTDLGAPPAS
ncbi:MAG: hypothetical protein ABSG65_04675 [Bryobacteraceae bacterium]|jgi:hypothetical protein